MSSFGSVAGRARTPARQPAGRRRYIPRSISSEEKTMGLRNLTVSLTLLVTATLLASIGALKVSIKEYDVPTPKARPHDPAVSPDGALWVTEQMANKLGRLDPNTGQFREYPLKTPESGPHGLVADKQGNIWFAAIFKGYIGKLDPKSGEITEYRMRDPRAKDPHTPVFGSSFPMYPLKMAANQMFPCLSATRPCGPESGVLSGYSRNCPVFGSSRPSLLAICSVTQSAPSGLTAGSCGRALGVGTSYSLMDTFSAPIEASSVAVTSSVSETVRLRRPIVFSSLEIDRGM